MTEPITTESATAAKSGLDAQKFASRRALVWRRFLRNKPAVAALALLVLFFIGCYTLPSLLPYSYTDLDYYALQQPPSPHHWFGTNALGQDLLAQLGLRVDEQQRICGQTGRGVHAAEDQ